MHSYTSEKAAQFVPNNDRLLRDAEVQKLTGVRKTRRADLMRDGKFPKPIKVGGGRTNYWLASEIYQFIATETAQYRAKEAEKLMRLESDPYNAMQHAIAGKSHPMRFLKGGRSFRSSPKDQNDSSSAWD